MIYILYKGPYDIDSEAIADYLGGAEFWDFKNELPVRRVFPAYTGPFERCIVITVSSAMPGWEFNRLYDEIDYFFSRMNPEHSYEIYIPPSPLARNLLEYKPVPKGSENVIRHTEIKHGNTMANFHNEYRMGRYYSENTYKNIMESQGQNPFTRENIKPGNVRYYKANVSGGGASRKRRTNGK